MKFLLVAISIAVCVGCRTTTVTFEEGRIESTSKGVVAEQTVKPTGETVTRVDTTGQSWLDKLRESFVLTVQSLTGYVADKATYNTGN